MDGYIIGVFGTEPELKTALESAIAKKSEAEGIVVYHRTEPGKKLSFLDDLQYPDKIQGYARIASLCDYAYYVSPSAKLTPPDGELAVLLASMRIPGSVQIMDGTFSPEQVRSAFRGLSLESYRVEERASNSSIIDASGIKEGPWSPGPGTLIYVDRAFNVKGVGVVVLGFVLSGKVSVHDKLRPIPVFGEKTAEVRGIQINDEDQESAGKGIRIGLSLKGVEAKDLAKTSWLDDGSFTVSSNVKIDIQQTPFYKQPVDGRDMHLQVPGEMVLVKISKLGDGGNRFTATLGSSIPVWDNMRMCLIDLNAKTLRVAGGCSLVP